MLLSRKCVYGLRAVLYVTQYSSKEYVSISRISEKLKISFHFLTKILQILTQHEIVISYRGPNGGIKLAKSAKQITILDIIRIIDGNQVFQECILGLPNCDDANPCPLHDKWRESCFSLQKYFSDTTIDDLVIRIKESGLRISGE
jgi:Rrf2 family transcriptional regulator, iron-sulfur cluster assembly transcription factor